MMDFMRYSEERKSSVYRCDVEHLSQLVENTLDVFGVDIQDGKLSSYRQTSISEDREYLHSASHINRTRGRLRLTEQRLTAIKCKLLPLFIHPVFALQTVK